MKGKDRILKRITAIICAALLLCGIALPGGARAAGAGFTDVPADSWAEDSITEAVSLGIIGGYGNGVFGYGDNVTRAQFAAMLVRLFGWDAVTPDTPTFADNADKTQWYYSAVETAVKNGAVTADSADFRPNDAITRGEMAVMLVRGLGYGRLAASLSGLATPFTDVTENADYIAIAYDFGIIKGMTATTFLPAAYATREQAAAMMIRLHDETDAKTDWLHAFYAISSYSQRAVIPALDAVSFGWSRMELDGDGQPYLNTTTSGGNSFAIPSGASEVVALAKTNGVPDNLDVFMSTYQTVTKPDGSASDACSAILLDDAARREAVAQITAELTRENSYTGVTIDFENMRGSALKQGFSLFLEELSAETKALGLRLYVCVPPVTPDGNYFDAYDYRTIGTFADKVILMAHDYAAQTLTQSEMDAGYTETPETPIYYIYYALKAITDSETGVQDKSKLVLALSFGSTEWELKDGKVVNQTALSPLPSSVFTHLSDPSAITGYSETYQNPYVKYHSDAEDADYMIWYEDARSAAAKVRLAHMFGVDGISVWRLGIIPDFEDPDGLVCHYDVLGWLLAQQ